VQTVLNCWKTLTSGTIHLHMCMALHQKTVGIFAGSTQEARYESKMATFTDLYSRNWHSKTLVATCTVWLTSSDIAPLLYCG